MRSPPYYLGDLQADQSGVATVSETKELKKRLWGVACGAVRRVRQTTLAIAG